MKSNFDKTLNILVAFPYFSEKVQLGLEKRIGDYRLIVDSGAFSAYNSGMEIKLEDYIEFVKKTKERFKEVKELNFVQLDVVFDEEGTKNNYEAMLEAGLDPCPVFTRGGSPDRFKQLLSTGKYIFVGGVQRGKGAPNFAKWVLENSTPQDKVHLLAFVRPDFINHYKPYSVDASSWTSAGRYGQLLYYCNGRLKSMSKSDFSKQPKKEFLDACDRLKIPRNVIKQLGYKESWINSTSFEWHDDPTRGNRTLSLFINTLHYVYYSIMAQNKIGTKIYMAVGDAHQLRFIYDAYDYLNSNGVFE
jgi:hypothetical protein